MESLYLDNCCFNRPFDDQTQTKIKVETLAKLAIQKQIIEGRYRLIWSYILQHENRENPFIIKRENTSKWQEVAHILVGGDDMTSYLIGFYEAMGVKPKDAAHLACATYAKADYFITTDRGLTKKQNLIKKIRIVNPVDFIAEKGD